MASAGPSADGAGAVQRLQREWVLITKKPVPGVTFEPGGEATPLVWVMHIDGPATYTVNGELRPCPYAGRSFPVTIKFPPTYPFKSPEMSFRPGVLYHPNVSKDGEICGDTIAKTFGPTKYITDLARMVIAFLETPNLESPLEVEAAHLMATALPKYEEAARKMAASAPPASGK